MRCPHCDNELPEGAAFCIECGRSTRAATDRTIQLTPPPAPSAPPPPQLPARPERQAAAAAAHGQAGAHSCGGWSPASPLARGIGARGGAIFLIGLGLLFLTGSFWPGILALLGVVGAAEELGRGRGRSALQSAIFFVGLAVIFASGLWWPGILIVLGLCALVDRV